MLLANSNNRITNRIVNEWTTNFATLRTKSHAKFYGLVFGIAYCLRVANISIRTFVYCADIVNQRNVLHMDPKPKRVRVNAKNKHFERSQDVSDMIIAIMSTT